jgi:GDP/UDP-N,N'-diacetylbacillosamine 2-epimerase (hydrolysing)
MQQTPPSLTGEPKKICYVSGTRADYGLMVSTLNAIEAHPALSLSVIVTGMHLSQKYGLTIREIEADHRRICGRINTLVDAQTGAAMARSIGILLDSLVAILEHESPDAILLLGDRGEMLAGALAAIHLNIPVVHIHGGERSGTVDEPVRHAISKLAHWHCVATQESRLRLIRMGEDPSRICVTGAPGLDGLEALASLGREELHKSCGFHPARKVALLVFHPVLQEASSAGEQAQMLIDALIASGLQVLALLPNADAGGEAVRSTLINAASRQDQVRVATHLQRRDFVSWVACADLMVGNSSSGIIEAATFGTPVINVGTRQNLRERNANVIDVEADGPALQKAIAMALASGRIQPGNVYGDGKAGNRIVAVLSNIEATQDVLLKTNAY